MCVPTDGPDEQEEKQENMHKLKDLLKIHIEMDFLFHGRGFCIFLDRKIAGKLSGLIFERDGKR